MKFWMIIAIELLAGVLILVAANAIGQPLPDPCAGQTLGIAITKYGTCPKSTCPSVTAKAGERLSVTVSMLGELTAVRVWLAKEAATYGITEDVLLGTTTFGGAGTPSAFGDTHLTLRPIVRDVPGTYYLWAQAITFSGCTTKTGVYRKVVVP
jgi:hypothetical protein